LIRKGQEIVSSGKSRQLGNFYPTSFKSWLSTWVWWTLSTLRDLRNLSSWVPILKRVHSQRSSSPVAPWKFNIYGSFLKWGYPQITKVMDNNFSIESTMVTILSSARRFQITGEVRFGGSLFSDSKFCWWSAKNNNMRCPQALSQKHPLW
jgi:hypothetical protein